MWFLPVHQQNTFPSLNANTISVVFVLCEAQKSLQSRFKGISLEPPPRVPAQSPQRGRTARTSSNEHLPFSSPFLSIFLKEVSMSFTAVQMFCRLEVWLRMLITVLQITESCIDRNYESTGLYTSSFLLVQNLLLVPQKSSPKYCLFCPFFMEYLTNAFCLIYNPIVP